MRRGITVLVVVVVVAIALAAGIDALRGESEPRPATETGAEPPAVSTSPEPEAPAPQAEFAGTLYYTDESCELQAIELPDSRPVEAPGWDECRFVLSPSGRRVSKAGSGWDPRSDPLIGRLFQSEDGLIQVSTNLGPEGEPFRGTAPAWRPDGTLTYFADGAVRTWPDGEVIVSQRHLRRAISRRWDVSELKLGRGRIRDVVWLDDRRLAVILTFDTASFREEVFALLEDDRLIEALPSEGIRFGRLWASPRGGLLALQTGSLQLFDRAGRPLPAPPMGSVRSIAFSADERWAAVATDSAIYIFRPGREEWTARINLAANDLAWRGEAGAPQLENAGAARAWLGDVGATGRLFLTDSDCRLRALRLPSLAWEGEPDAPLAPCRFNLAPTGDAVDERIALQPQGELRAYCEGDDLDVYVPGTNEETVFADTCPPAWMPDGRLTFVHQGELYAGEPDGDMRLLTSRNELLEMFGRTAALEEIAWVDDERFWAVVRSGEGAIVALMTTDRLLSVPSFTAETIKGLRVGATMVAARTDRGVVFLDSGDRRALTFPNGRAVSWAPDEMIAAVATPTKVVFVAPASREVVTLPLAVRDLEWVVP